MLFTNTRFLSIITAPLNSPIKHHRHVPKIGISEHNLLPIGKKCIATRIKTIDCCKIENGSKRIRKILNPFENLSLAAADARAILDWIISTNGTCVEAKGETAADEVLVARAGGRAQMVAADHREHVSVGEAVRG